VTFFAAPEARGAHFCCGSIRHTARALRAALLGWPTLLALVIASSGSGHCESIAPRPAADAQSRFSLIDTAGTPRSLDSFARRGVVVHFFATWCEPCRAELPALDRLAARARDGDMAVVAIAVAEPAPRVRRFLAQTPVSFPVLLDEDRAVAKSWGVTTLPTSFVLGADLRARFAVAHEYDWDHVDPASLIDQPSRETPQ
jgi:thiol-disulfide isomerase/thioredoxin